jgi:MFS family permease
MIVVSLLAGMLADRLGTQKVFASAVFTVAIALFLTISGLTGAGIISAFIAAGIAMALAPAEHSGKGENGFRAIAVTTSWRDSGAAFGALAGGMLYGSGFQVPLFAVIAACILLRSLSYGLTPKKSTFKSIPWK